MPRISSAGAWIAGDSVASGDSVPAGDSDVIGASSARSPCRYATSGPPRRGRPARQCAWTQLAGMIGSGAGVLPQLGAGGQVTTEPSFMPASAASILDWMSDGSLLAAP